MNGILEAWSRVDDQPAAVLSAERTVGIELDTHVHRFLPDHLVGGRPLLATVIGIEAMAGAVCLARPGEYVGEITDIHVGAPFLLPASGRGRIAVTVSDNTPVHCTLRSDGPEVHLRATVAPGDGAATGRASAVLSCTGPSGPAVPAETVYGLYFHGPSFQVIESARRAGDAITARLATGRAPIVDPPRSSLTAPLLIELCMQAAGLWDLVNTRTMRIPRGIERLRRWTDIDADSGVPVTAVVTPRLGDPGPTVFDAVVVDAAGTVHLELYGYRTALFPHELDTTAAERIRAALGAPSGSLGEPGPRLPRAQQVAE